MVSLLGLLFRLLQGDEYMKLFANIICLIALFVIAIFIVSLLTASKITDIQEEANKRVRENKPIEYINCQYCTNPSIIGGFWCEHLRQDVSPSWYCADAKKIENKEGN